MSLLTAETRSVDSRLRALGFEPAAEGYRRHDWRARCHRGWWRLVRPWPDGKDELAAGGRGLWKWAKGHAPGWQVFEWPGHIGHAEWIEEETAGRPGALEQMFGWAQSTAEGQASADWAAPERAEVESWCSRDAYTIEVGHLLRQVDLRREPGRLALETPVISAPDLAGARLAGLRRLALEVQGQWPMVRMRWEESTGGLAAEIDLSGAPPAAGPDLISAGLASLRGAATSLVGGAEVLADVTVASEALAFFTENTERTTT